MKLHELKSAKDSRRVRDHVGCGVDSGNDKASARGQKGQKARSGNSVGSGFRGGQLPLFRRLPKRGLTNTNHKEYAIANLDQLNQFEDGIEITPALLVEAGAVKNEKSGIKVLDNDSLDKKLTVKTHKSSASAVEAIDAKDGAREVIQCFKRL